MSCPHATSAETARVADALRDLGDRLSRELRVIQRLTAILLALLCAIAVKVLLM